MTFTGNYTISERRERLFVFMLDPGILQRCIPGCQKLTQTLPDHYDAELKLGVAAIKGAFKGKVRLEDKEPPAKFTMVMEGSGSPGWVKGIARIELNEGTQGTEVRYTAEVTVGGLMAGVGSRMIGVLSKQLTSQFFEGLARAVAAATAPPSA